MIIIPFILTGNTPYNSVKSLAGAGPLVSKALKKVRCTILRTSCPRPNHHDTSKKRLSRRSMWRTSSGERRYNQDSSNYCTSKVDSSIEEQELTALEQDYGIVLNASSNQGDVDWIFKVPKQQSQQVNNKKEEDDEESDLNDFESVCSETLSLHYFDAFTSEGSFAKMLPRRGSKLLERQPAFRLERRKPLFSPQTWLGWLGLDKRNGVQDLESETNSAAEAKLLDEDDSSIRVYELHKKGRFYKFCKGLQQTWRWVVTIFIVLGAVIIIHIDRTRFQ